MFLVDVWFYLKYEKEKRIIHISITKKFVVLTYYFYVYTIIFKCHPLSILVFGAKSTFWHRTIVTNGRQ